MISDIEHLAVRIEAAEIPDRELDAIIAIATGNDHGRAGGWCNSDNGDYWTVEQRAAHYTSSLDDGIKLARPGWTTIEINAP